MLTPIEHGLLDTLNYLRSLIHDSAQPKAAVAQLQELRQRYPSLEVELLWDEQAYDGSTHYDVLLREVGAGTVSLSFCPEHALPWPMRGVQRWSDQDLLKVNATNLKVEEGMALLDFIWDERPIMNHLVSACLIREVLDQDPIELSDEEMQRAMDGFRRGRRLYTTEDTQLWMSQRGMSHTQLEQHVANIATTAKLRERVIAGQVDAYFAGHAAAFDTACVVTLDCEDEAVAMRILERIWGAELSLYAAAEEIFTAGASRAIASSPLRIEHIRRGEVPAELAEEVFDAQPGEVVGLWVGPDGCRIVRVLSLSPARLDVPTRKAIEHSLFDAWLEERRKKARIAWNWGRAEQTPDTDNQAAG